MGAGAAGEPCLIVFAWQRVKEALTGLDCALPSWEHALSIKGARDCAWHEA